MTNGYIENFDSFTGLFRSVFSEQSSNLRTKDLEEFADRLDDVGPAFDQGDLRALLRLARYAKSGSMANDTLAGQILDTCIHEMRWVYFHHANFKYSKKFCEERGLKEGSSEANEAFKKWVREEKREECIKFINDLIDL